MSRPITSWTPVLARSPAWPPKPHRNVPSLNLDISTTTQCFYEIFVYQRSNNAVQWSHIAQHDKWLCEDQIPLCGEPLYGIGFRKLSGFETVTVLEILPGICSNVQV
jgi:hypothetical protein